MITYILDGQQANPVNRQDIKFRLDFSNRRRISEFDITVDNLIFAREDYTRIFQHLDNQGRYVGMPFDIVFSNGQILRYYIDFTDPSTTWTDTEINVKIKPYRRNENFFDQADNLSWRLINWQPSDFTEIEYIVIPEGQAIYVIGLQLALFSTLQETARAIQNIAEAASDLQEATIPSISAAGVPVINIPLIVSASIKLAARIAYAIFIISSLIQLLQQIIEIVFPKVRTFKDIPMRRLIAKGCEHLGFQLDSQALDQLAPLSFLGTPERSLDGGIFREIFMPNSFAYNEGFPTEMDSMPTLGAAISAMEELYNLRTTVSNGTVKIERYDFYNQTASTPIPLAYNDQEGAQMKRTFNDEFWKRKLLVWAKDMRDVFTYDDKKGHICEVDTSNLIISDQNLNLLKGFEKIDNPFSLASRKETLTFVEKLLKNTVLKAVDLFTGGSLQSKVQNRIGVMTVSSQYYSNNKLLWKQGKKIAPNHRLQLAAKTIMEQWHDSETVKENTNIVIENMPIRMNEETFLLLSSQNNVNLNNGTVAELVSLEWSEEDAEASATLKIDSDFGNNTKQTIINGGGI